MLDTNAGTQITYNDQNPYLPNGNNVVSLTFGTESVDFTDAATYYNVSTVNYLAAGSCNFNDGGVSLWPLNQIVHDTQYYVRDAVINYAKDMGTIAPVVEGRLKFVNIPTATFTDVATDYWAWSFIERLYAAGITSGCSTNPLAYCPEASVTRAQMAVFLLKGLHGTSYTPPTATGTVFGDVPTTNIYAPWIEQLALEGITAGCGNGNYCPDETVTRAQMAVFLLKSKHGTAFTPLDPIGIFGDVPTTSIYAPWIEQLATEGITAGCGNGNYCPENSVTRAEMAVFLVKTFNLP
jgi:hypothetical protein